MIKNLQKRWLMMALVDIVIASASTPLSFCVALAYGRQAHVQFVMLMCLLVVFNIVTYSLGWFVSWRIYSKGW